MAVTLAIALSNQFGPIAFPRTFASAFETINRCRQATPIVLNFAFRVPQAMRKGERKLGLFESSMGKESQHFNYVWRGG